MWTHQGEEMNKSIDDLDSYEKIMNEGLRMQRLAAANPGARYNIAFTVNDDHLDEFLISIVPDFKHMGAILVPDTEFAKAPLDRQEEATEKVVHVLKIWGIEEFRINVGGKLGNRFQTELCPEELWLGDDFIDKIPERELSTEEIRDCIKLCAEMKNEEQRNGPLSHGLIVYGVGEYRGISVEILPHFKEKSATVILDDKFDLENKSHMGVLGFAVAMVKLWDLQRFTVREP